MIISFIHQNNVHIDFHFKIIELDQKSWICSKKCFLCRFDVIWAAMILMSERVRDGEHIESTATRKNSKNILVKKKIFLNSKNIYNLRVNSIYNYSGKIFSIFSQFYKY